MDFERAKYFLQQASFETPTQIVGVPAGYPQSNQLLRSASVLMAVMNHQGEAGLLITKRSEHLALHPGEIAFPGGKPDAQDKSDWDTALREAEEEIGLLRQLVTPIGQLNKRVTRSDFVMTPCVGLINSQPELLANEREVAEIFALPFSFLLRQDNWLFSWQAYRGEQCLLPSLQYKHHHITGVTAKLIVDLMNQVFNAAIPTHDK